MSNLFWLSAAQMERLQPHFPKLHGRPRVDDRRVLSGIIFIIHNGLRWCDAPREYGPHKTLYNRFVRWSRKGVFEKIFEELAKPTGPEADILMIDATHLKAHRIQPQKGGGEARLIGRTKGGMNSKLHTVGDGAGGPIRLHLTAGQRSGLKGTDALLPDLPPAKILIADRGYDSAKVRKIVSDQDIMICTPSKKNRKEPIPHCEATYKKRHKIENIFAKLKDWRRIAMRYDRCAHTFKSAIYIAATVIFWL